jgi:hypothetical protein
MLTNVDTSGRVVSHHHILDLAHVKANIRPGENG